MICCKCRKTITPDTAKHCCGCGNDYCPECAESLCDCAEELKFYS